MTYLNGQSRRVIKSWYIGGGQEQRFRRCFPEGLIFKKKMVWTNVILLSIYSRSAAVLRMISGVKSARFGIENVGQPETVTITQTLRMSSVLPTVFLLAWPVHWEFPAW